ncbi:MAG: hypothetical protein RL026_313 [Pseudomonadota bacterium]|jgi:molybdate transport repressor ModE-like protein
MFRVEIEPVWRFTRESDARAMLVMLDFLNEIRATGKITRAADRAEVSYRHAWNLIAKWSAFFGQPLVERRQGRGTTLTPLGERLVWAGQRLQARLGPQLQNLAQELQSELDALLRADERVLRVHASHGFAVSALRDLLAGEAGLTVDFRYVGNVTTRASLATGACELAGMHLPRGELRDWALSSWRDLLDSGEHCIIRFVTREMGLMVARGNPQHITGLAELGTRPLRLVNREPESGTRMLFDELLRRAGVDAGTLGRHAPVEFTHAAVAAYIASGMADVSFGVEAAARQFELGFQRLVTEDYLFVCHRRSLELPSVQRVLAIMRSPQFMAAIAALPGYSATAPGEVWPVERLLDAG